MKVPLSIPNPDSRSAGTTAEAKSSCCPGSSCGWPRRDFLKFASAGLAATFAPRMRAMAGPFEAADFTNLVPADKKLDPAWVKSLFARGERTVYRGAELEKIGMPIGGIGAGQLYLGGDGRLWRWDIFNHYSLTGSQHYAHPPDPDRPLEQGFAVKVVAAGKTEVRTLDRAGFPDVTFCGEYPIGFVEYRDAALPVSVSLEAFSPFIPLNADDSALPATVMKFTVKNTGPEKIDTEIAGWIENAVGLYSAQEGGVERHNRIRRRDEMTFVECSAVPVLQAVDGLIRSDIVFENFEKETYDGWTVEGTAFGTGPIELEKIPRYQGFVGGASKRVVNSHATAPGSTVGEKDNAKGKLTSREFQIERKFITFFIGGGDNPGLTCLNLVVDGKLVRSATGKNANKMSREHFAVGDLTGKTARIEIVDNKEGPWGNIGVSYIVFTDYAGRWEPATESDFGTMGLALLGGGGEAIASLSPKNPATEVFSTVSDVVDAAKLSGEKLLGALTSRLPLEPGEAKAATFVVTWHFPNHHLKEVHKSEGHRYAARFADARAVAQFVAENSARLSAETRLWHDTWYDSTLPFWFLDRTFLNTSTLATSTCDWFADGRFYSWEGVGCCAGTCTHVWHYAHAAARVFPQLERDLRERTDFGLAFDEKTGVVRFRGEGAGLAIDGQAGVILRTLREHQTSADDAFLKRNWPRIKRALQCLIEQPGGADGLLNGAQHNTLDTYWFGPVAWLNGLYLAALRAGEQMARETGDEPFAQQCADIFARGSAAQVAQLFNGEYFVNKPDETHPEAINSGTGCEIDQVMGQSWAWQVALGRVLPEKETRAALQSLWRYNFTPDVGPYRAVNKPGRWYAMPGEGGLLMCTFPRADWDFTKAAGKGPGFAIGYFNECMNGFEYQAAWHMIAEGMVMEGLAIARMVHDRYHAARRNPWNEVECGDHYVRSMASYGVFVAACGFEHHGPHGHIGFAPKLTPENFRAPFTAAEGWGTFAQKTAGAAMTAAVALKYGTLRARSLALTLPEGVSAEKVRVTFDGRDLEAKHTLDGRKLTITLSADANIAAHQALEVAIS